MKNRRVVITGMGTVNPLGHDVETTWAAMLACKSGVAPIRIFDARTFPTKFAAEVKDYRLADHVRDAQRHAHASRHCQFALGAAARAWEQSGLAACDLDRSRLGVYMGSGEGSMDDSAATWLMVHAWKDGKVDGRTWAQLAPTRFHLRRELEQEANMVSAHLAAQVGARGSSVNVLTACAASTQALGEAALLIREGEADVMLSGGAHSMIHPFGMIGFNRLTALSTRNDDMTGASRPFDADRDGFVLGEGASVLVLEEYELARARGATLLAEVVGYGASADAFRITDQDPRGLGGAASMLAALRDAGMGPHEIDYISAHGTGTKQNDLIETRAVKAVFGDTGPWGPQAGSQPAAGTSRLPVPPMSSVKSMVGHLVAAAGATELITCVLAIRDQVLPPTINLHKADPECDLDYVPNAPRKAPVEVCMSNSFGFGGQNNTIIVRRAR
jgi:3-oxoacyl-[acyl-carrier-protein] synthase II